MPSLPFSRLTDRPIHIYIDTALTALLTVADLFNWHADDDVKRSASDRDRWLRCASEEEKGHADESWLFDLQETAESM
jgi:hypothetical protein